ncbi:MAG: sugar phosphate isomerase/epimerase [Inquilinus sp.]|nr:sugar phosphate isomerase/epimerase [Inquilinus sp.]
MARLGAHTFIWAAEWTTEAAERILATAAAARLDVVEIPLLRPDEIDVAATVALAARHGVAVTCSLGLPQHATLPDHPAEAEAFLKNALEVAARLDSPCLTGVTYSTIGKLTGAPPTDAEYATIARALKPVARHAASLGLELGLEPCNRYETHLLNQGRQAVELIERIGEDNVFVHLDTYHMNIEEKGFAPAIEAVGRHCRYVHLSESDRGVPGTGTVDWDGVFAGLAAIGYAGDMVLESFMVMHPDIARALAVWRPVARSSEELVEDGFGFLRARAAAHGLLAG